MCVCVLWRSSCEGASIREGLCEPQMFQLASFPGRRALGSNSKATGARKEGERVNMSRREKLLERKALTNHFVTSMLWQARERERERALQEGTNKRAAKKRKEVWRSFPLRTAWNWTHRPEEKQAKYICTSLLRFSRLLPAGTFFGRFISFILGSLHLSFEARGLIVVSLIFPDTWHQRG